MITNQKHVILIVGLLFGVAFLGGYFVKDSTGPTLLWPENAAMAAGGTQDDSFAMAVGRVDSNVEGVYILDFLTGELTCTVLDYRGGKFRSIFKANVIKDLRIEQVGHRKFLMLSGEVNFPRGVGAGRAGSIGDLCAGYEQRNLRGVRNPLASRIGQRRSPPGRTAHLARCRHGTHGRLAGMRLEA